MQTTSNGICSVYHPRTIIQIMKVIREPAPVIAPGFYNDQVIITHLSS
jgi:hypothetical protein